MKKSKKQSTGKRVRKARKSPSLSLNDRRELRNFQRFLRLKERFLPKMLTRERWQRYLGLSPEEARRMLENGELNV